MNAFTRILLRLGALVFLLAPTTGAGAQERILDYRIEVEIRPDASLQVAEHITVRAEGVSIRRGIYRDFPTRYRDRFGNRVMVDLEVLGVERDGQPEPWFTENLSNGVRINTGNDDFLPVPADIRFTLRYRTTRQIGFFADHDELYWNAIGTGWEFPIEQGQVDVRLPGRVPTGQMQAEGYTGPQGAKGQAYSASLPEPGRAHWQLTAPLAPQEGFTLVLSFPKGLLPEPSRAQRAGWLLRDNLGVLVALAGLVALWVYCFRRWRQIGRDPRAGVLIARYEPPAGRAPSELRFLSRKCAYDMRCFTSDLLLAATHGQLELRRSDVKEEMAEKLAATGLPDGASRLVGKLLAGEDVWSVHRTASASAGILPEIAQNLVAHLLPKPGASIAFKPSERSVLMAARMMHTVALKTRIEGSLYKHNLGSVGIAALIAVGSGVLALVLSIVLAGGAGVPLIVLVGILMVPTLILFALAIAAPTPEGRRLLDEIEGLRSYLRVAERDELKNLPGPDAPPALDAERYQRLLPYAVALDVEEAWTRKFTLAVGAAAAAAATSTMSWYHGGSFSSLDSMVSSVSTSLTSSVASASTPPGSSSGSGGGGSSGGGGGGGGGGGR